jgi:micrococcal nuclease
VPVGRYLRLRRPVAAVAWVLVLLALAAAMAADRRGWFTRSGDLYRYDGQTFLVTHVVDGDTLDVAAADGDFPTTRVRFLGVDTPEMDHPGLPRPRQPFAPEATRMTRTLTEGKRVTLRLESQQPRDRYGRLLAFVELPGGKVLNEELLAAGLARAETRWPHHNLERYERIEDQAKHDKRGMWGR